MHYAANTTVTAESSRAEIEKLLRKEGAAQFAQGWDTDRAVLQFTLKGRMVRIVVAIPSRTDRRFTHTRTRSGYRMRTAKQVDRAHDQEIRRRWRALLLVIKAKLESVASGIATLEEEFMPWIVLPDGSTVGEFMSPQIERAYAEAKMPSMLPGLPPPSTGDRS